MSRRRGEFEHRTSIFEGAFRAWSHLGGIPPEELESKPATELDPLTHPLDNDERIANEKKLKDTSVKNPDGTPRRIYPYEPLPRSGLAHPYVQAILSPWLGPDADHDAIQLGLTTLRTWWQHRRKGESGSAIAALGTDKMRGVVEGYTRHFFNLAHCLIVNDKEQPPRTLHSKMRELEKIRSRQRGKNKRIRGGPDDLMMMDTNDSSAYGADPASILSSSAQNPLGAALPGEDHLSPLERLHAAQRRQLAENGLGSGTGLHNDLAAGGGVNGTGGTVVSMKGKCVPGKLDLDGVVDAVNHQANQLAYRGGTGKQPGGGGGGGTSSNSAGLPSSEYGDPNTTPVVFVSHNGDIMIAMNVEGITCAHCVKIVETVLRGCNGNKSPIDGLLDAAADRFLSKVLIKIDQSSSAKRIAFEAARNLSMVGYTARPMEMNIVNAAEGADKKVTMDLGALSTAFEVVANSDPKNVFDWNITCQCPDSGIVRDDCPRHSQMNSGIFDAFEEREQRVSAFMAGCGSKYGMPCTCGPNCKCQSCSEHCRTNQAAAAAASEQQQQDTLSPLGGGGGSAATVEQFQQLFGMGNGLSSSGPSSSLTPAAAAASSTSGAVGLVADSSASEQQSVTKNQPSVSSLSTTMHPNQQHHHSNPMMMASRSPSIVSFGGMVTRHMSFTSEATFGRAMSGLSALAIDWENMEDFDVTVDHSAHINNSGYAALQQQQQQQQQQLQDLSMFGNGAAAAAASSVGNGNHNTGATNSSTPSSSSSSTLPSVNGIHSNLTNGSSNASAMLSNSNGSTGGVNAAAAAAAAAPAPAAPRRSSLRRSITAAVGGAAAAAAAVAAAAAAAEERGNMQVSFQV